MSKLNGSFGQADGLVGTLGTDKSLTGQLGGSLIPGPKGDKGEKGDKGDRGETGETGLAGPTGPQGDQGPQGETGPKGDKGDTGERGETGATGPMGPQGDRGPKGDDYILTQADKQEIAGLVDTPVDDVRINGASIVQDGVANVPIASTQNYGVVKTHGSYGLAMLGSGVIRIDASLIGGIKAGADGYHPITPQHQHESTFYGLAKASGDTTQSQSSNPVGTYTEEAKTAIRTMLGLQDVYDDYSSALTALGVI